MMAGWIYILESEKTKRYYVGSTEDLENRKKEHNNGENKSTKYQRPWRVVFSQRFEDIKSARRIEIKLKRFKSRNILKKIIADGTIRI